MNTIPLTFNERQLHRTVLSGNESVPVVKLPLGVLLLNTGSGGLYRVKLLENLIKNGFSSIVSVEKSSENYNVEDFARMFPCVKFIVPMENVSVGDMINLGMGETDAENVLVINDSIQVGTSLFSPNSVERYITGQHICVVPRLVNVQRQVLPVRFSPVVDNSVLKIDMSAVITDRCPTLYPFDFIGIYNKSRFLRIGGYDYTITAPYWQNLDFSVRAWLWGEQIIMTPVFQLAYGDSVPVEDSTPDQSQLRFYLKNSAPKYSGDYCYIPISRFFQYKKRSAASFSAAYRQFSAARRWVEYNKYRFQMDVSQLINRWESFQP